MSRFTITSPAFEDGDWIPKKHTGIGEDLSPEFHIRGISEKAKSIIILFDDLDNPIFPEYNHWILWNLPVPKGATEMVIPEGIPSGATIEELAGVTYVIESSQAKTATDTKTATDAQKYKAITAKNVVQGIGFGTHKYRGPCPPVIVRKKHEYKFTICTVDCFIDLSPKAEKANLLKAVDGHVLQIGELHGFFQRGHKY